MTVVFITGTFFANNCWDSWKSYFEKKGYTCLAPAWPFKDVNAEELRNRHPDHFVALNRLGTLTDYFAKIVQDFPEKPILIGHSLGGLIVQLLLQRDLGVAGVALHSFPPQGINTFGFSFLRAWWECFGFFSSTRKTYMIPFVRWKYTIANGMTCEQQKESFYAYAVPESKALVRDAFRCIARVNFKVVRPPLLLISGGRDRIIPASLNYRNYKKYKKSPSDTDYKEFESRNHLDFEPSAWKEDADFILNWLTLKND